jgi:hypothetical protein
LTKFYPTACTVLLTALLCGCATIPRATYYYDEVVVINQSRSLVRDVEIRPAESGRVFSCGNIAPRGICSNRFRPQVYRGSPIQFTWAIGSRERRSEVVELQLPVSFVAEISLRGVFLIGERGEISAYLQQDQLGPHL